MPRVEKKRDGHGKLIWAKGMARDVYKDMAIANSKEIVFRISGEARPYNVILPRHCAGSIIGERFDLNAKLPPFRDWRFILVGYGEGTEGSFEISREVSGDVIVVVDALDSAAKAAD
jgi:hypothetical protein